MQSLIDYLNQYEWFRQYLDYVLHMSATELWLFFAITAILLIYIFYKWFGVGGLAAIVVFMFLIFVVVKADLYGMYLERQHDNELRQEMIERELSKDKPGHDPVGGGSIGNPVEE